MHALYSKKNIIDAKIGNNIFAWENRIIKYKSKPTLSIPSLIEGDIDDVKIGKDIAFEEIEDGVLRSCIGLQNFVHISVRDSLIHHRYNSQSSDKIKTHNNKEPKLSTFHTTNPPITIFDNHNHALYFWIDAVRNGIISPGFELIHIDEHSDLWDNENELDLCRAIEDIEYSWNFTNLSCNVGNYIHPAIRCGLVGNMIRIENEYQIDEYMDYIPTKNSILNLDLDIFATELDHISEQKKIQIITNLIQKVRYVTIATSPFFIDQQIAISKLQKIIKILNYKP